MLIGEVLGDRRGEEGQEGQEEEEGGGGSAIDEGKASQ
jgi:hypothetical protein